MENANSTKIKPHKLRPEDIKATIHIDSGDYYILKVYKRVLKAPMRAVLHFMIGRASKCWEEKHDQQIRDLEERVRIQAFIIVKYIEKYGQLRVLDQLCRHLVQNHLLTPVTKPQSEPLSQRALRIGNALKFLQLVELKAGSPEAVRGIMKQVLRGCE